MASAVLNLRMKLAQTSRCKKHLVRFLRDNRWPVEAVKVSCQINGKTNTRRWDVYQYPPDLLDEIVDFVSSIGDDVDVEIEISEGD